MKTIVKYLKSILDKTVIFFFLAPHCARTKTSITSPSYNAKKCNIFEKGITFMDFIVQFRKKYTCTPSSQGFTPN